MADEPLRLGGMALRNGLFVHGPTHWAAAVRAPDGGIRVASGSKTVRSGIATRVPVARGVVRMSEMLAILPQVKRELPEARLAFENPSVIALSVSTVALTSGARRRGVSPAAVEALASALAVLPALAMLRSSSLARYHGAEHKTIGAYESGGDAHDEAKEHDRCGSHLVTPLVALSLAGNVLASRARREHRAAARAGASLAAMGIAVELFGWATRNAGHPLARAFRAPGTALQRAIGTREPADGGAGRGPRRARPAARPGGLSGRARARPSRPQREPQLAPADPDPDHAVRDRPGARRDLAPLRRARRRRRPQRLRRRRGRHRARGREPRAPRRGGTRTYGWGRVEILAALVNGLTLVGLGVLIAVEAIARLGDPPEVRGPGVILFGLAGVAVNGTAVAAMRRAARAARTSTSAARCCTPWPTWPAPWAWSWPACWWPRSAGTRPIRSSRSASPCCASSPPAT